MGQDVGLTLGFVPDDLHTYCIYELLHDLSLCPLNYAAAAPNVRVRQQRLMITLGRVPCIGAMHCSPPACSLSPQAYGPPQARRPVRPARPCSREHGSSLATAAPRSALPLSSS